MSNEIKTQNAPEPLAGTQEPLADERRGKEFDQDQMASAVGRGTPVELTSRNSDLHFGSGLHQGSEMNGIEPRPASPTTSGLSVSGVEGVVTRRVDERVIEGSGGPADYRQRGKDAVLPPNPSPRSPKGQARLSSKLDE